MLNSSLGYAYPWGFASRSYGLCKIIKTTQKKTEDYIGTIFYLGVCKRGIILIWGYAKVVKYLFGGTHSGTFLIWGLTEGYSFDLGVCKYQKFDCLKAPFHGLTKSIFVQLINFFENFKLF